MKEHSGFTYQEIHDIVYNLWHIKLNVSQRKLIAKDNHIDNYMKLGDTLAKITGIIMIDDLIFNEGSWEPLNNIN